jgi:urease accessory protein
MTKRLSLSVLALVALTTAASAHPGHGTGLVAGLVHPLTGLDHIAAMVAVGLLAARLGGRALWAVPASFVAMMAAGGAAGMVGVNLPVTEMMVMLSVVVLGALAIFRVNVPLVLAMSLAGVFAMFHGLAHGAELPAAASGLTFAAGFVASTVALHGLGIGLGLMLSRLRLRQAA